MSGIDRALLANATVWPSLREIRMQKARFTGFIVRGDKRGKKVHLILILY